MKIVHRGFFVIVSSLPQAKVSWGRKFSARATTLGAVWALAQKILM